MAQTLARESENGLPADPLDMDLARINAAWPDLAEPIRRAILAMLDAAG